MIDPEDLGQQTVAFLAGYRNEARPHRDRIDLLTQLGQVDAVAEMRGNRGEDVTPGEGRSGRAEVITRLRQHDRPIGAADHGRGRRQQAVVGSDEDVVAVAHFDGHGSAGGADPGIDDGQDDTRRQVLDGPDQRQRARADIVGWDLMADVDDVDAGGDAADDRLDHADELVGQAVVAEEGNGVEPERHRGADANRLRCTARPGSGRRRPPAAGRSGRPARPGSIPPGSSGTRSCSTPATCSPLRQQ